MARRTLDPAELEEHLPRLYRAALALCAGDRTAAEDLVQETCAQVLARPRTLAGEALPYLLRALRNTHLNQRRGAGRRPQTVELDERVQPAAGAAQPDRAAEYRLLLRTIAALPPRQRDVLVAVDIVGLSYAEAARFLRTTETTVATRLFRARDRVANELEGRTDARRDQ